MKHLLSKKLKQMLDNQIEHLALTEAIKREIEIIYPSLVSIGEAQNHFEILVPNGKWEFTKSK